MTKNPSSNLPNDFDWKFYIDSHKDLQKDGIDTEFKAIRHYLDHGRLENRAYKKSQHQEIQQTINKDVAHWPPQDAKIVLFTQWYENKETEDNRLQCLKNNIDNLLIDHIHIFCEIGSQANLISVLSSYKKVSISFIRDVLSYKDWMEYANRHYTNDIKILANSDIYFDETIQLIRNQQFNYKTIYAITRKDLNKDGQLVDSNDFYEDYTHPTHPLYSQDCWIYMIPLKLTDINLIDYKLGYENCDRLFKKYLETDKVCFVNLYPNINAIHVDYRQQKHRNSYDLNYTIVSDRITDINDFLDFSKTTYQDNVLEAIALLLTGKETHDGQYKYMLQKILYSLNTNYSNQFFAKLLDFKIIVTHHTAHLNIKELQKLKPYFKSISILPIHIPKQYDFYNVIDSTCDLKYGDKSGPNYCFFKSIEYLSQYNTTLFLECDCSPVNNWIESIYNYCRFSGRFWISGAHYDGSNIENYHSIVNQHINGGSAMYATGHAGCISFLQFCFALLPLYVKKYSPHIPYDYCIYQIIEDYFNFDHKHRSIWQFIKRCYIQNNLIMNYSTYQDIDIDVDEIIQKYNPAIIHQKLSTGLLELTQPLMIPDTFDENLYLKEHPDAMSYYVDFNNVDEKTKLYHHYLCYGRYQKTYHAVINNN